MPFRNATGDSLVPDLVWPFGSGENTGVIVSKLSSAVANALAVPAVRTNLLRTGYIQVLMTAEQYASFVADDVAAKVRLSKEAHIKLFGLTRKSL